MKFYNPLIMDNSKSRDPFIVLWRGNYYSCYNGVDSVVVRKFESFEKILDAEEKKVFIADENQPVNWFAPEMHLIDGHWYIYGAPSYRDNEDLHSMHVLRSVSEDPFGEYEYMGALRGTENKWSIDATVFTYNNKLYTVLDMRGLHICEMTDPLTMKGEPILLSEAEYPWEREMNPIIEGPAVLVKNGRMFIVYSASDCRCDGYCLGLLTFKGGDVLDSRNWEKTPESIFKSANGLYGPGHCSFTKIGNKDMVVYHANTVSGSGMTGSYLCAQPIEWVEDTPVLNEPIREFEL